MNLHKNSVKLAGLYLAIIMLISLFFSATIYQLSTQELDRGLRRPGSALQVGPEGRLPLDVREALRQDRDSRYQEAKDRVLDRLVITNIIILIVAGFLSYYLALRTLKPIEEAHAGLERFTADASHELRTPIAAMRAEIEVALSDPKLNVAHAREILESSLEELAKLTALSEGLLKLARLEHKDLPKAKVSMSSITKNAVKQLKPLAKKKSITINIESAVKANVIGNEASLQEVLTIILDNAIKYSPDKSQINIGVESTAKEVVVRVKDRGVGIKAAELPYIFERFYRADSSRARSGASGYGLGLAIAKDIIQDHQGKIIAESSPGAGTTFIVTLPVS